MTFPIFFSRHASFFTERARPAFVLIDGNLMTMRLNRGRAVEGGFETGRRLPRNRFSRVAMTWHLSVAYELPGIKRVFAVLPTRRIIDRSTSFSRQKATLFFHCAPPFLPR